MTSMDTSNFAMRDFILSSPDNFNTALLVHQSLRLVNEKLISDLAKRVAHTLDGELGWEIVSNTLATSPMGQWSEIKWAPSEWTRYRWGLNLEAHYGRGLTFGLQATTHDNPDPARKGKPSPFPAMPDDARALLANALSPVLLIIGPSDVGDKWWPRRTPLPPEVLAWDSYSALSKIRYATERSGEPDLISGKPLDDYLIDAFRAAKEAIMPVLALNEILPVPE